MDNGKSVSEYINGEGNSLLRLLPEITPDRGCIILDTIILTRTSDDASEESVSFDDIIKVNRWQSNSLTAIWLVL